VTLCQLPSASANHTLGLDDIDHNPNNVAGEAAGDGFHEVVRDRAQNPDREGGEDIKDFATTDQDSVVDRAHENSPND
jgi:hypothetical protein